MIKLEDLTPEKELLLIEHHIANAHLLVRTIKALQKDADSEYLKEDIQIHKTDLSHHITLLYHLNDKQWDEYQYWSDLHDLRNIVPSWIWEKTKK